jgi:hypothetical protein
VSFFVLTGYIGERTINKISATNKRTRAAASTP